jgi:hypothetical protein
MRDYFSENFEWNGSKPVRRKKRVLPDGDRVSFSMTMMDQASYGFTPKFADGSPDHSNPNRPGFRFLDVDDAARIAANDAYEQRRERLHYANRYRKHEEDDQTESERRQRLAKQAARATMGADQARELADAAWEDRKQRMQNAWRNR